MSPADPLDPALAAVLAVAGDRGLDPRRVVVLRQRANLVVHLVPHPVVARTPLWTLLVRPHPERRLGLEVGLSRWAAGRGGSVVVPLSGPHRALDRVVTLWPLVGGVVPADPEVLGRSLADLHVALAGYPGDVPGPDELVGYCRRAAHRALAPSAATDLERRLAAVAAELDARVACSPGPRLLPLHGDAHPGNAVLVDGRATWWDLEDSWRGPAEWDVAVLVGALGPAGPAALDAYLEAGGPRVDQDLLELCARLRALQAEAWGALARAASSGRSA